jgi:predicted kinase
MELLLLIGLQGAGKSTFYHTRFASSHAYVSKDLLHNNRRPARRQLQLVEEALRQGQSVVVDNTNASRAERNELIELGKRLGARVIGYYFETNVARCRERNALREGRQRVPEVAIFATLKRLERPDYSEGFDELFFVRNNDEDGFDISPWQSALSDNE